MDYVLCIVGKRSCRSQTYVFWIKLRLFAFGEPLGGHVVSTENVSDGALVFYSICMHQLIFVW